MRAAVSGSLLCKSASRSSQNTTPQPPAHPSALRSRTTTSRLGSNFFIKIAKKRPAGPPPTQTICIPTPIALFPAPSYPTFRKTQLYVRAYCDDQPPKLARRSFALARTVGARCTASRFGAPLGGALADKVRHPRPPPAATQTNRSATRVVAPPSSTVIGTFAPPTNSTRRSAGRNPTSYLLASIA